MATTTIATATSIKGTVFVRDAQGNERVLHQGDVINAESKLVVTAGGRASLKFANGEVLVFGPGDHMVGANMQPADAFAAAPGDVAGMAEGLLTADAAAARIAQAIRQGQDIDGLLEETAAGAAGGGASEGHGFVRLDRISEELGAGSGSYRFSSGSADTDDDGSGERDAYLMSPLGGAPSDTTPPGQPTVTIISDADNNGYLTADELNDGKVEVRIDLPADAQAGDIVEVTDGNTTQEITLTPEMIEDGGITIEFDAPGEGEEITITATITDPSGNTSPAGEDSVRVDTVAPDAPTVTLTSDANDDGFLNGDELAGGKVQVQIDLPPGTQPGDKVTVTDGTTSQEVILTPEMIGEGQVTVEFDAPGEGEQITVTATITDPAGNVSDPATDSATVDTTPPGTDPEDPTGGDPKAPTVTLTSDANDDGWLNA
ncbi:hypothetical protein ACY05_00005, partial [Sterolibacterium denitrificans]